MPGFTKENAHWSGTFHFSKAHDARPYKKGMLASKSRTFHF